MVSTIIILGLLTAGFGYTSYKLFNQVELLEAEVDALELELFEQDLLNVQLKSRIKLMESKWDSDLKAYQLTVDNLRKECECKTTAPVETVTEETVKPKRRTRK